MLREVFFTDAVKQVAEGREYFASGLKAMIKAENKNLFALLDEKNTDIFLHPMLFSYLNADSNKISCEQILYDSVIAEKRPERISVYANPAGQIHMPGIGYLETGIPGEQHYELVTLKNKIGLFKGSKEIPYSIKNDPLITGTNIDIQCIPSYLTDLHLPESTPGSGPVHSGNKKNAAEINKAVSILKNYYPAFYSLFTSVTKCLVPFSSEASNSFASLAAHGTAFINTYGSEGTIFFLEDLVHQCGHIIFSTITYKPDEYFLVDPQTMINDLTGDEADDRSLYVLFHGIFTEALMCEMFDACIENEIFKGEEEHELQGRLCYILLRFILDIEIMEKAGSFSPKGQIIYDEICNSMIQAYKKYGYLLKKFDLGNQPYNFDPGLFLLSNPLVSRAFNTEELNNHK